MVLLYLAAKDLLRSLRSAFLVIISFVVPVGLSALMYFAFGGFGPGAEAPAVERTVVLVVNEDEGASGANVGTALAEALRAEDLADWLDVRDAQPAPGASAAEAARAAVDRQEAGVALVVPAGLTAAALGPGSGARADVTLHHDPTLTVAPSIVQGVASAVLDHFSGAAIAVQITAAQLAAHGASLPPERMAPLAMAFSEALDARQGGQGAGAPALLTVTSPSGEAPQGEGPGAFLGLVFAGQMIFAAFFAAAHSTESILREEEEGTLARLFTTPTPRTTILGGKFLTAALLVLLQTITLMAGSALILGISWGSLGHLVLLEIGLVVAAAGLGAFLLSLVRTRRASGAVIGGALTISSMLGGLFSAAITNLPAALGTLALLFPQGWAMRGWRAAMQSGATSEVLVSVAGMLVYGGVLFAIGATRFRRRFA